ncbi:Uncharacterised protein [Mycobacteroides abscessus subsp. abscessus]|nr:Uncharacterised protein [Mycobacteroides abscessus subsp. abscessus]SKV19816.1 Uncharacterised protein [Mycobacteroides abscessus subsp. abscessus]
MPTFLTHQLSLGQPLEPSLLPRPLAAKVGGTSSTVLMPMPISMAAATVKILKIDPAPSPTREKGCGCMVWKAFPSRP